MSCSTKRWAVRPRTERDRGRPPVRCRAAWMDGFVHRCAGRRLQALVPVSPRAR
jgi:hypothetical protein